jgi:hypothetical protein
VSITARVSGELKPRKFGLWQQVTYLILFTCCLKSVVNFDQLEQWQVGSLWVTRDFPLCDMGMRLTRTCDELTDLVGYGYLMGDPLLK